MSVLKSPYYRIEGHIYLHLRERVSGTTQRVRREIVSNVYLILLLIIIIIREDFPWPSSVLSSLPTLRKEPASTQKSKGTGPSPRLEAVSRSSYINLLTISSYIISMKTTAYLSMRG